MLPKEEIEKVEFTKERIDFYLKELSKAFRKENGSKARAEIILIGGASVVINYNFRDFTYDNDAEIRATSSMKQAINSITDKYSLPNDWLNSDFTKTNSYSPKLREVSQHYKTFSNIIDIRTVSAEYLISMKLMSGRTYKNDFSDIIGIISESRRNQTPISLKEVNNAFKDLYGSCDLMPQKSKEFLQDVYKSNDLSKLFNEIINQEKDEADIILKFQEKYPNVINEKNIDEILAKIRPRLEATDENSGDEDTTDEEDDDMEM